MTSRQVRAISSSGSLNQSLSEHSINNYSNNISEGSVVVNPDGSFRAANVQVTDGDNAIYQNADLVLDSSSPIVLNNLPFGNVSITL